MTRATGDPGPLASVSEFKTSCHSGREEGEVGVFAEVLFADLQLERQWRVGHCAKELMERLAQLESSAPFFT